MKIKYWLILPFFLFLFLTNNVKSQELYTFTTSETIALGQCSITLPETWSTPSSIHNSSVINCIASYENKYALKELSTIRAAIAFPNYWLESQLLCSYFGFAYFNEQLIGLNLSKRLTPNWIIGIRFDYFSRHIINQTERNAVVVEGGITYDISKKIRVATSVFNPFQSKLVISEKHPQLPIIYKIGVNYHPATYSIIGEITHSSISETIASLGLIYSPYSQFSFLVGFHNAPNTPSFGLNYHSVHYDFGIGYSWHSRLGGVSSVSFNIHY